MRPDLLTVFGSSVGSQLCFMGVKLKTLQTSDKSTTDPSSGNITSVAHNVGVSIAMVWCIQGVLSVFAWRCYNLNPTAYIPSRFEFFLIQDGGRPLF